MIERLRRITRRAGSLSARDLATLTRMFVVGLALPILSRALSLPVLLRLLDSKTLGERSGDPSSDIRLARSLLALNVGPFKPDCYTRSLLLFHVLRRHGHPVAIVFGVKDGDEGLAGHAWIELDGAPLDEDGDPRSTFSVTFSQGGSEDPIPPAL